MHVEVFEHDVEHKVISDKWVLRQLGDVTNESSIRITSLRETSTRLATRVAVLRMWYSCVEAALLRLPMRSDKQT